MCGPQNSPGHWKRPDAMAAAFVELDGKRFFRSGNLGRMINAPGFKVWPTEVETLMCRHPAVQEACVISTRDSYQGESVKAMVVQRPAHKGQVNEQDIVA